VKPNKHFVFIYNRGPTCKSLWLSFHLLSVFLEIIVIIIIIMIMIIKIIVLNNS